MQLPRVLILATGGTIATTSDGGQVTGAQLIDALPVLGKVATVEVEDIARVDSSALGFAEWSRLVGRIRSVFANDPELAGVVVTHGTDMLEETAFLLDLVIADARPVVVTGSMRPSEAVSPDGPANIVDAVKVAAAPASRNRGTLVVLDTQVYCAGEVAKTNTMRVAAFAAPDSGPVGQMTLSGLKYLRPAGRQRPVHDLTVEQLARLPRVEVIYSCFGGDGALIKAAIAAGAKGLVVAAFGSGAVTPAVHDALLEAVKKGVTCVASTRVGSGPVTHVYSHGRSLPEVVESGFLNPAKARILLMILIASGQEVRGQCFL